MNGIDEEKRQEIFSLIRCTLAAKKKPGAKLIGLAVIGVLVLVSAYVFASGTISPKMSIKFAFYRTPSDDIQSIEIYEFSKEPFVATSSVHYLVNGDRRAIDLSGFPLNAYFFGNLPFNNFLIIAREEGHQIITSLLRYDSEKRDLVLVPFIDADGSATTELCCAYITHVPKNFGFVNDIVLYDFHRYTSLPTTKTTYRYSGDAKAFVALRE